MVTVNDCQFHTNTTWIESEDFTCPDDYQSSYSSDSAVESEVEVIDDIDYSSSSSSIETVDSISDEDSQRYVRWGLIKCNNLFG